MEGLDFAEICILTFAAAYGIGLFLWAKLKNTKSTNESASRTDARRE